MHAHTHTHSEEVLGKTVVGIQLTAFCVQGVLGKKSCSIAAKPLVVSIKVKVCCVSFSKFISDRESRRSLTNSHLEKRKCDEYVSVTGVHTISSHVTRDSDCVCVVQDKSQMHGEAALIHTAQR